MHNTTAHNPSIPQPALFSSATLRQLLVILALSLTLVVNALANALPLNGQGTGEISDRFKVFFVPAGYVFAIWGVIYLALIAYAVYQALPAQRGNPTLARIAPLFIASNIANSAWIFLWHYEQFPLTLIAMLALLGTLIAIYLRLGIGQAAVSAGMRWLVHLPFSLYLGWVTVATIANLTDVLDFLQWGGFGLPPQVWAVILLAAAATIAALISLTRRDVAYLLVLVWAVSGIAVKQAAAPLVANSAWVVTAFVIAMLIVALRRKQNPA
jgi:translocator protein